VEIPSREGEGDRRIGTLSRTLQKYSTWKGPIHLLLGDRRFVGLVQATTITDEEALKFDLGAETTAYIKLLIGRTPLHCTIPHHITYCDISYPLPGLLQFLHPNTILISVTFDIRNFFIHGSSEGTLVVSSITLFRIKRPPNDPRRPYQSRHLN
jgi:hypothetical protein